LGVYVYGSRDQVGERREAPLVRLAIDPAPRRLRQTLALVDERLAEVEAPTLRRVRLILSEIVGRSAEPPSASGDPIHMEIDVLHDSVRIELAGGSLALPEAGAREQDYGRSPFPSWVLFDLADNWGIDRRQSEPGIWLLVDRPSAHSSGLRK
jgi:hypothetical protein